MRASVRRAIAALANVIREPIPQPPADYDDDGDSRDSTRPHALLMATAEHVDNIAQGSGEFLVVGPTDVVDDFDDETKPRLAMEREDAWAALRGDNGGRALLDGLRAHLTDRDGDAEPADEPAVEEAAAGTGAPEKPSA
jgi:hypothetical protein